MFSFYDRFLDHNNIKIQESIVWLLSNLSGESINVRDTLCKNEAIIKKLYNLAKAEFTGVELIRNLSFFFSSIIKGKPEVETEVLKKSLEILVLFFKHNDFETIRDALWGISHISDSDNPYVQRYLIDENIIKTIIMTSPSDLKELKIPVIRILGNLISKNDDLAEVYNYLLRK